MKKRYYVKRSTMGDWYNIYDRHLEDEIIGDCDKRVHAQILVNELNKSKKKNVQHFR